MPDSLVSWAASTARRAYRAILPAELRRRLRGRFVPRPARKPPVPVGPRRFALPIPQAQTPQGSGPRRETLIIEAPRHLFVARHLHEDGLAGYEPATAALMLALAERLRPTVVFDVGANVGPLALLLPAVLDVPVVAFEPSAEVAEVLRSLVAENDLDCTVVETAVGEADGTATFFISPTDTSSSLRAGFRDAVGEVTVPVLSLDSYLSGTDRRPSLIKLDTETTEPAVLRGATGLLADRPWILCEVLPGWTETEIEGLLRPLGYRAYQVVDTLPLPERVTTAGTASFEDPNWLYAPEEPDAALWEAVAGWRRAIDALPLPQDLPPTALGS